MQPLEKVRRLRFARAVCADKTPLKAYWDVYGHGSSQAEDTEAANELLAHTDVQAVIERAHAELEQSDGLDVMSVGFKRELLRRVASGEIDGPDDPDWSQRLKAVEIDNKMAGHDAPAKTSHEVVIRWGGAMREADAD